jgi:hypothetical protein
MGSTPPRHQADDVEGTQGISNRPANEEHAFPEDSSETPHDDATESVEDTPKQQGGNRGSV